MFLKSLKHLYLAFEGFGEGSGEGFEGFELKVLKVLGECFFECFE